MGLLFGGEPFANCGPGGEPDGVYCGFMALGPGGLLRRPCICEGLAGRSCMGRCWLGDIGLGCCPLGVIGRCILGDIGLGCCPFGAIGRCWLGDIGLAC